jgi:hypothetical protein
MASVLPVSGRWHRRLGRGGSLIPRSTRASAAVRPPAGDLVLLADTSLVLEPNFYLADVDCFFARDFIQARWTGTAKISGHGVATTRFALPGR